MLNSGVAITNTWLTTDDTAVRAELCPVGYKISDRPRTGRRGGEVGLIYYDLLSVWRNDAGEKESFEYSEWTISSPSLNLRLVLLYCPPYSADHRVSTTAFFNEFSTYIETILLSKEHCWWAKYPRRCLPRSSLSQTTRSFKVCRPPAIHHRAYANSGSHTWSRYTMLSNSAIRRLSRKTPMTPGFSFDL